MPISKRSDSSVTDRIKVHIIAGPTASGKTARAIALAREVGGVIINADSMQVYDALPTLTAQPTDEEQAQSPHRLFSVLSPEETCSAQIWREMALKEINRAADDGHVPIIAGGTGLYLKALLEGFSPIPDIAPDIRDEGTALQKELGNPAFHQHLSTLDPVMAGRLNPNDTQRLIRAWEVLKGTGKSLSYWQEQPPTGAPEGLDFEIEIVMPERPQLYERCNRRFDLMIESGILGEVAALDEKIKAGHVPENASITNALGFKPLRTYLEGETPLDEATEQSKQDTRNYAKRQMTWIRNQLARHL